jgi:hypothetical protein
MKGKKIIMICLISVAQINTFKTLIDKTNKISPVIEKVVFQNIIAAYCISIKRP